MKKRNQRQVRKTSNVKEVKVEKSRLVEESVKMDKTQKAFVYKNASTWRGGENLYLDRRTADVFFVFRAVRVRVPAHKSVLSAMSPEFQSMFNGTIGQKGVVRIVGTTVEAFKVFLKFFYLGAVELSSENALEVMSLGKKYAVANCLEACVEFCKATLTLDSMCWAYELAILFELDELKRFCEQKISQNPHKIFHSVSFLLSESNLLHHILQLDSMQCDEITVFDGCIAWAKEACIQQELDENDGRNVRNQLGDLFFEIRFGKMNLEHFYERYCLHKDLFSVDEFEDILSMIALKDFHSEKFNRNDKMDNQISKGNDLELKLL